MFALFSTSPDGTATLTLSTPTGSPLVTASFRTPTAQAKLTRNTPEALPEPTIRAFARAFASLGRALEKGAIPAFVEVPDSDEFEDASDAEEIASASEAVETGTDSETIPEVPSAPTVAVASSDDSEVTL